MRRVLLLALLAACPVQAARVDDVAVSHAKGRYTVHMQAWLDVPPASAHAAFTDYTRLPEINNSIEKVAKLDGAPTGSTRLETTVRVCVAFFCKHLHQVQDLRARRDGNGYYLKADVLPARSDLRYGKASWSMKPCRKGTCLDFQAQLEPDFWVPPLIGPWLIQRKLRGEALQTAQGIEKIAHEKNR